MDLKLEQPLCPTCTHRGRSEIMTVQDHLYKTDDRAYHIVRCTSCHLVYLTPRPTVDSIEHAYPKRYLWNLAQDKAPPRSGWARHLEALYFKQLYARRAHWVEFLLKEKKESKIGDLGCGRGGFLKALHRRGYSHLYGMDLSASNIQKAREECPDLHLQQGNISKKGFFKNQTFDLLTLWHILEHVHDPALMLAQAHKHLKPGGWLVVGTQNFQSFSRWFMGPNWPLNDVPRHLFHFTRETLKNLLEAQGFRWETEWKLTESFPVLGGHLLSQWILQKSGHLRMIPALAASLACAPAEWLLAQAGYGCLLTVAARKV